MKANTIALAALLVLVVAVITRRPDETAGPVPGGASGVARKSAGVAAKVAPRVAVPAPAVVQAPIAAAPRIDRAGPDQTLPVPDDVLACVDKIAPNRTVHYVIGDRSRIIRAPEGLKGRAAAPVFLFPDGRIVDMAMWVASDNEPDPEPDLDRGPSFGPSAPEKVIVLPPGYGVGAPAVSDSGYTPPVEGAE